MSSSCQSRMAPAFSKQITPIGLKFSWMIFSSQNLAFGEAVCRCIVETDAVNAVATVAEVPDADTIGAGRLGDVTAGGMKDVLR